MDQTTLAHDGLPVLLQKIAARCGLPGAAVLSWSGAPTLQVVVGPLAIIGACIAWGLDNNLTRKVSLAKSSCAR